MKKASEDMRAEYDFSGTVRGKYSARSDNVPGGFRKGTNVVVLEPEIAKLFPSSEAVNDALRILVQIAKQSQKQKRTR
jgi:hypothetical protein